MVSRNFIKNASFGLNLVYDLVNSLVNIQLVEPLHFTGLNAGNEFLVYNANKVYICEYFNIGENTTGVLNAGNVVTFYNLANAAFMYLRNDIAVYDAGVPAIRYVMRNNELKNFYFSRYNTSFGDAIIFSGYRVTFV